MSRGIAGAPRRAELLNQHRVRALDVENLRAEHETDANLPAVSKVASLNGVSGRVEIAGRCAPTGAVERQHNNKNIHDACGLRDY